MQKERRTRWEREGKGKGEREEDRMKKKEKEKKEKKEKEKEKNGKNSTKNAPLSPNAFPSTKLGNNITLIEGRLGKNTTPTSSNPSEPSQNP